MRAFPRAALISLFPALLAPVAAGEDPAGKEIQILEAQTRLLACYDGAQPEVKEKVLLAIQSRILGWKKAGLAFQPAQEDRINELYEKFQVRLRPQLAADDESHLEIHRFLHKTSGEDLVKKLIEEFQRGRLQKSLEQLERMGYPAKRLDRDSSARLLARLKEWIDGWDPAAASPAVLAEDLELLRRASLICDGPPEALPQAAADFALRMGTACSTSPPAADLPESFNPCLEKLRSWGPMKSSPPSLARMKARLRELFCYTPRSLSGEFEMEPQGQRGRDLLARSGAEPVGRAELVAVQYLSPGSPAGPRRVDAREVGSAEDFYLLNNLVLILEYQLSSKAGGASAGEAAPPRAAAVLMDSPLNKKPGKLVRPLLPMSFLPDHAYLFIESSLGKAWFSDSACWSVEKTLARLSKYLLVDDSPAKAKRAERIRSFLADSSFPPLSLPDAGELSRAADPAAFLGCFKSLDPGALKETLLLRKPSAGPDGLKTLFSRGGLLEDGEELPPRDLAAKMMAKSWAGRLGFSPGTAISLQDDPGLSSEGALGESRGICAVVILSKKVP